MLKVLIIGVFLSNDVESSHPQSGWIREASGKDEHLIAESETQNGEGIALLQHQAWSKSQSAQQTNSNRSRAEEVSDPMARVELRSLTWDCEPVHEAGQQRPQCNCVASDTSSTSRMHPAAYQLTSMWKPTPSATVLNGSHPHHGLEYLLSDAYSMLPAASYNPSLLRLPQDVASSLHPDAHFLAAVRHSDSDCKGRSLTATDWRGDRKSSILVLDSGLKTLIAGTLPLDAQDYRFFALDGKILLTGNSLDSGSGKGVAKEEGAEWNWKVFELNLELLGAERTRSRQCPTSMRVRLKPFKHGGLADNGSEHRPYSWLTSRFNGKNIGMMYKNDGDLQLLWMLSNPVDVRDWAEESQQVITDADVDPLALRNNGNPVFLPEHNAFLAVGHSYWELNQPSKVRNYIHRFVLFDAKPPHRWLRASQPFCFSAISAMDGQLAGEKRNEWCEGVEFIMSWLINGSDLLVTYGINDCESGIARLPLQSVLNSTSPSFSYELPLDASRKHAVGLWSSEHHRPIKETP